MKRVAFVSCVKTKSTTPELAEHLYISPWFRMAREYARKNADRWFILSAEHGLLNPGTMVDPYNTTLNGKKLAEREAWSVRVIRQIADLDLRGDLAVVLAGQNYRAFLMNPLTARFGKVNVPMEGLQMGEQLSWLKGVLGE